MYKKWSIPLLATFVLLGLCGEALAQRPHPRHDPRPGPGRGGDRGANGMIFSDRNGRLALNAWGGARQGAVLMLVDSCNPNNPDCTWTASRGALISDRNPNLKLNAYGGARNGTTLKLYGPCPLNNPDCTWTFVSGP